MRAALLLLCLSFPVAAQAPSPDDFLRVYLSAGWSLAEDEAGGGFVCMPVGAAPIVTGAVLKLYERAKGVTCS